MSKPLFFVASWPCGTAGWLALLLINTHWYVRVNCVVVSGCALSRRYINVCDSDVFNVGDMYLDHLKLYGVCINGRRYVCCKKIVSRLVFSQHLVSPPAFFL